MTDSMLICDPNELRTLFLFEKLDDDQLAQLCEAGRIEYIDPGPVYREGEPATCFYVLIDGAVRLTKLSGGIEIEINRTDHRGVYAGAWMAYLGDKVSQDYAGSMYVERRSRFLVLAAADFARMVKDWFPMAVHLLEGAFYGGQKSSQRIAERERLLALGSLSAGLTHELNLSERFGRRQMMTASLTVAVLVGASSPPCTGAPAAGSTARP
ncbi:cyclic nucleotide-binding domain-containing protein, partial [Streptomyces sp. NPDC004980]